VSTGDLIDGRNRMEGCRRGGVPPTFVPLGQRAPVALILSANVARRHLSKGQQAMAVARAGQLSTRLTSRKAGAAIKASHEYVNRAVTVLEYAPDLADSVLLGATPLNEAYEEARHRKQEAQERREIELEENLRRKDLTPFEQARELVRKAPVVAEAVFSKLKETHPTGRPREMAAPKKDVAEALGTSEAGLIRAEQHVATAEAFPFMQSPEWSQSAVLREEEREGPPLVVGSGQRRTADAHFDGRTLLYPLGGVIAPFAISAEFLREMRKSVALFLAGHRPLRQRGRHHAGRHHHHEDAGALPGRRPALRPTGGLRRQQPGCWRVCGGAVVR
jgi:hypothetical protein